MTAINGTKNVLEYEKKSNIEGMVYLSSLEVYGKTEKENITEHDYGFIDILSPRSSYSEGKKIVETMCISYGKEYGVPVKIARSPSFCIFLSSSFSSRLRFLTATLASSP